VGDMTRLGLILMTMSLLCAAALGFVNDMTEERIALQRELARTEAMNLVAGPLGTGLSFDSLQVPGLANPYEETGRTLDVVGVSSGGTTVGYVFTASRKGYSSVIETLVALDTTGLVVGSTILYQSETPGLGTRYADSAWQARLAGLDGEGVRLTVDGGPVQAVTGATVSGRAVTGSVADGVAAIRQAGLLGGGGE